MPGYFLHFAACGGQSLENRTFVLGVEAPDILKKHVKVFGTDGARAKYEAMRTSDTPEYSELEVRIHQKESSGSTKGLHYGVSSSPNVREFWNSLSDYQKNNPFYRGYAWHLLTDAITYGRLNIDEKFNRFIEANKDSPNIEELKMNEIKKLHDDWDKLNARVRDTYPGLFITEEVKGLGVIKFITKGDLVYVDWNLLRNTIDYLRTFDPIKGDMDVIIENILKNI